jgi:NADPH-dependent ferric siderophore reductase
VAGPDEEQKLSISAATELVWVHRGQRRVGDALVEAVSAMDFPAGQVQAFVHGEANCVKRLRHLLRVERGVAREQLSISGYWRRGTDEDGWQSSKREWNERVELDEARALAQAS